jgi:hypothetical protein
MMSAMVTNSQDPDDRFALHLEGVRRIGETLGAMPGIAGKIHTALMHLFIALINLLASIARDRRAGTFSNAAPERIGPTRGIAIAIAIAGSAGAAAPRNHAANHAASRAAPRYTAWATNGPYLTAQASDARQLPLHPVIPAKAEIHTNPRPGHRGLMAVHFCGNDGLRRRLVLDDRSRKMPFQCAVLARPIRYDLAMSTEILPSSRGKSSGLVS